MYLSSVCVLIRVCQMSELCMGVAISLLSSEEGLSIQKHILSIDQQLPKKEGNGNEKVVIPSV